MIIRVSDHLAEELWQATNNGCHGEVLKLLQRGVPPDSEYYWRACRGSSPPRTVRRRRAGVWGVRVQRIHDEGLSPLCVACCRDHSLSAEYLLKWGASVTTTTTRGETPLHFASAHNSMDCVRLLLEHHCPTGEAIKLSGTNFVNTIIITDRTVSSYLY